MDFSWTDEQIKFRNGILEFGKSLSADIISRDKKSEFSRSDWNACAQVGLTGMAVPKIYGGSDQGDILSGVVAMEAMGLVCRDLGLLFALNAQMWTVQLPLLKFGTEDQKHKFLAPMCQGQMIGAHVLTEPNTGSDVFSIETTATKCDGGYRLNGKKRLITLGPLADVSLVFATIDPKLGKWGLTAFLVERNSQGYTAGPPQEKMGLRTVPLGNLDFNDCFVPESNRLGPEGAGFSISQASLEYERCCILASQIGFMEYQLDQAAKYARKRQQFGQPIGKFQSVSNRIADMKMRIETSKLLLYKVAWLKENDKPAMLDAALLKLYLSECYVESSMDAIRIHGGNGYLTDKGIERDLRDAMGGVLYAGTSDIQRNIISKMMGL